jgi:hypothetical protein
MEKTHAKATQKQGAARREVVGLAMSAVSAQLGTSLGSTCHTTQQQFQLQEAGVGMQNIAHGDNLAPRTLEKAPFAAGRSMWDDLEHNLPPSIDTADPVGFDVPSLPCVLSDSTSESEDTDADGPWFVAASCLPGPACPLSSIDLADSETYDHRWASMGLNVAPISIYGGWR